MTCPTCTSPAPHLHPAVQHEGEVEICRDPFHLSNDRGQRALRMACLGAADLDYLEADRGRR